MSKGLKTLYLSFRDPSLTHFGGMILIHRFCKKTSPPEADPTKSETPLADTEIHQDSSKKYRLPTIRPNPCPPFCYYSRDAEDQQNRNSSIQWSFSLSIGTHQISKPIDIPSFPQKTPAQSHPTTGPSPRSTPSQTLLSFKVPFQSNLRSGFRSSHHLWKTPICPSRLQSQKTRTTFLYHPLFCFEAHLQEFWHASLRPGNVFTSTGAIPFIKVCLSKVPKTISRSRIRFRADSGFFNKKVIEWLGQEGSGYVIVAKEYPTIKARARSCRFKKLRNGWEVGEFRYQPYRWEKAIGSLWCDVLFPKILSKPSS